MDDLDIVHRIGELADEEHSLERSHEGESLSESDVRAARAPVHRRRQCPIAEPPFPSRGMVAPLSCGDQIQSSFQTLPQM